MNTMRVLTVFLICRIPTKAAKKSPLHITIISIAAWREYFPMVSFLRGSTVLFQTLNSQLRHVHLTPYLIFVPGMIYRHKLHEPGQELVRKSQTPLDAVALLISLSSQGTLSSPTEHNYTQRYCCHLPRLSETGSKWDTTTVTSSSTCQESWGVSQMLIWILKSIKEMSDMWPSYTTTNSDNLVPLSQPWQLGGRFQLLYNNHVSLGISV